MLTSLRMDFPQALSIHNSNGRQWELGSLSTPEHQSPQPSSWNMLKCLSPTKANWIVSWNQSGSGPMCLNLAYYTFTEKVKTFIKTTGCTRCQGGCKQNNSDQWLINQDVKDNTLNFKNTFSLKFKTYHLMEVACIWEVWETNRNFVEKNIQHLKDISALTSVPYHWKPIHRKVWANPWTQAHSDFGGGKIWTQIQILQMVHPYNGQNQHSGLKHLHTFFQVSKCGSTFWILSPSLTICNRIFSAALLWKWVRKNGTCLLNSSASFVYQSYLLTLVTKLRCYYFLLLFTCRAKMSIKEWVEFSSLCINMIVSYTPVTVNYPCVKINRFT